MEIFDIEGHKIRNLISEWKDIGDYYTSWNGLNDSWTAVAGDIYILRVNNLPLKRKYWLIREVKG